MKRLKYGFAIISAVFASVIFAQFTGPGAVGNMEFSTVSFAIQHAGHLDRKDISIKLKGFIIEQINAEEFWFQDTTGKMRVEIDAKRMPLTPFDEKSEVIIYGEVDADLLEGIELEVKRLTLVKP